MSDSYKIYRTIHNYLQKTWKFDPSQGQKNGLNILTGFICGNIQSKLANVAVEISGSGKKESQIIQLRRWLKNEKVGLALNEGRDRIVHRTDRCDLSLFTLGCGY